MNRTPRWLLALLQALRRIRCGFMGHGEPIGAVDVPRYDVKLRILRYRSYAKCKSCGADMGDW